MLWLLEKSPYFYLGADVHQDPDIVNALNPLVPPVLRDDSEGIDE